MSDGARPAESKSRAQKRAIVAACVGNAFEWYDFTVYALFAIYIAKAFFPGGDATTELVKAFLAFGVGFLVRPLGALLLGLYGDHAGRKAVLTATIGLMALGTGIIAVAPGYMAIGVGAPILLLVGRVLQGFSAGGEIGGAASLLIEHAPPNRKGEFASWLQATMSGSNIMGALVAFTVTSLLAVDQIEAWGWRLPFAFGLLIFPIGLWIRASLDETPEFEAEKSARDASGARVHPLRELFGKHPVTMLKGWALAILWTVSSYSLVIYMPTYVQKAFAYTPSEAFLSSLVCNILMVGICVAGGIASDRIGRQKVLIASGLWLAVTSVPALWLMQSQHNIVGLMVGQIIVSIGVGVYVGVAPSALAELFPARIRSTATSVCYNLAVTIFSGFGPALLTWVTGQGVSFAPGWYVLFAGVLAAPALISLKSNDLSELAAEPA